MNKKLFLLVVLVFVSAGVFAAIPQQIGIQGRLTDDDGNALAGSYAMTFKIYDVVSGGTELYDSGSLTVVTDSNGIYDVILTSVSLDFGEQYFLGITVGADSEMTPRINMTSSPYSFRTNESDYLNLTRDYRMSNLTVDKKIIFSAGSEIEETAVNVLEVSGGVKAGEFRADYYNSSDGTNLFTWDGSEIDVGQTLNASTKTIQANEFIGNGSKLTGLTDYNSTGFIQNWNASGFIINPAGVYWVYNTTYDSYNVSGYIQDWNATELIQNWNASGFLQNWNASGFIINPAGVYWVYNTTYDSYNVSGYIQDWNATGLIVNANATGLIQNYNASGFIVNVADQGYWVYNTTYDKWAHNQTTQALTYIGEQGYWVYNTTYDSYNSTGYIQDWNATGLIANANATGLIQNYNASGFIVNVGEQLGTYVPYSGATGAVDLGDESLTTTSTGTFGNVATDLYNASDGTSLFTWDGSEIDAGQNINFNSNNVIGIADLTTTDLNTNDWDDATGATNLLDWTGTWIASTQSIMPGGPSLQLGYSGGAWAAIYGTEVYATDLNTDDWDDVTGATNLMSWDGSEIDVSQTLNASTKTIQANEFIGNGSKLSGLTDYNSTGFIQDWNATGLIVNVADQGYWVYNTTYDSYNATGYIQDWNATGFLQDWNATGLIVNVADQGYWVYNTTYDKWAHNQTTQALTYIGEQGFWVYNTTYDSYNATGYIQDWNADGYIQDWNATGLIANANATGLIQNYNASGFIVNVGEQLGTYVPYSGATGAVDLGDESLTTTSTGTFGNVATDFYNASDGSTNLMSWDSGNAEIDVSQNMSLVDDSYLKLGTGHDADIYFDGSKLVIKVT